MLAVWAATSSSSVLLPTPGSPASRMAAPGTSPPPSTRSSSGTPLGRKVESATLTWPIGTAGVLTGPAAARSTGAVVSRIEPQAWHSPHRPTHLVVSQPHSLQRWAGRGARAWADMVVTLGERTDRASAPHRAGSRRGRRTPHLC